MQREPEVPEAILVVATGAARAIAQGLSAATLGDGQPHNYRALLRKYSRFVDQWMAQLVETHTRELPQGQFTLSYADPELTASILRDYNFPADPLMLCIRTRKGRSLADVVHGREADEYVYILTAPAPESEGVILRRLM